MDDYNLDYIRRKGTAGPRGESGTGLPRIREAIYVGEKRVPTSYYGFKPAGKTETHYVLKRGNVTVKVPQYAPSYMGYPRGEVVLKTLNRLNPPQRLNVVLETKEAKGHPERAGLFNNYWNAGGRISLYPTKSTKDYGYGRAPNTQEHVIHEYGHYLQNQLSEKDKEKYEKIWGEGFTGPTDYARSKTVNTEDFAESFALYMEGRLKDQYMTGPKQRDSGRPYQYDKDISKREYQFNLATNSTRVRDSKSDYVAKDNYAAYKARKDYFDEITKKYGVKARFQPAFYDDESIKKEYGAKKAKELREKVEYRTAVQKPEKEPYEYKNEAGLIMLPPIEGYPNEPQEKKSVSSARKYAGTEKEIERDLKFKAHEVRYAQGVIPLHPNEAATHQRFGTNPKYIATNPETGEQKSVEGEGYGIYLMEPHKYLSLAAPLSNREERKRAKAIEFGQAKELRVAGDKHERNREMKIKRSVENVGLKDMPMLIYDPEKNEIVGHEGRHRAIVAQQMGKKLIPVRIQDEWRYQKPHFNFDSSKVKGESRAASAVHIIRDMNEKYGEKEAEKQIEQELEKETEKRVAERRMMNEELWKDYLKQYPEDRPRKEKEFEEDDRRIRESMERIGTGKTTWGVSEENRNIMAEEAVEAEKKAYEYSHESKLVPKQGGYAIPQDYIYDEKKREIMPVERPKEIGVGFSTLPDEPTRAISEPSEDMFMTKEGRKEARKYAGSEEEIDAELESLYGKD